jgi:WD40 repeat protein
MRAERVHTAAFSDDGRVAVADYLDGYLVSWELASGTVRFSYRLASREVYSVLSMTDGRFFAVTNLGTEEEGEYKHLQEVTAAGLVQHSRVPMGSNFAISGDGMSVARLGEDGNVTLQSFQLGRPRGTPFGAELKPYSLSFGSDSDTIVTANDDGSATLWRRAKP